MENRKALKGFTLPKELAHLAHLPVYSWCDDQGETEWIEIGPDGSIWHMIGTAGKKIVDNAQVAER